MHHKAHQVLLGASPRRPSEGTFRQSFLLALRCDVDRRPSRRCEQFWTGALAFGGESLRPAKASVLTADRERLNEVHELLYAYLVLTYRELGKTDVQSIDDLEAGDRIELGDPWHSVGERGEILLAERDGRTVGMVFVRDAPSTESMEIARMFVPGPGKTGVGGELLAAAVEIARLRGSREVTLTVIRQRPTVAAWYRRAGFEDDPQLPESVGWRLTRRLEHQRACGLHAIGEQE